MRNWQQALDTFLKEWKKKKNFLGAILTGSYTIGLETKDSDIDLAIVLPKNQKFWQRGNLVIDGFLIEYIADPSYFWEEAFKKEFESRRKVSINMFAIGKILFDKNGEVAKLKHQAEMYMKKPFPKMDQRETEMAKYHIYWGMDKLESLKAENFSQYAPIYYLQLSNILNYYAQFFGVSLPAPAKIQEFLNNSEFRKKYQLVGFSDDKFVEMVNECYRRYDSLDAIRKLSRYVLDKLGGLDSGNWTLQVRIEK